ncbi:hypothetical protein EHS25_001159 [Saitozyma podzolica]|uniref:C2H2-type domain-containing protein n=1 Tax=Saitozyma podzolica TaxID=1890683 RepID=A0A427YHR5_9TREE|nr:hypothetical protein EHS25_001159 [Saitozyma podzolica]
MQSTLNIHVLRHPRRAGAASGGIPPMGLQGAHPGSRGGPSRARGSNGKGKDKEYGVVDSGVSVEDDANRLPEGFVSGYGTKAWKECGKVFPDERLLELRSELRPGHFARSFMLQTCSHNASLAIPSGRHHFALLHHTETHDPIARERQSRGDKIFGCFLPTSQCGKVCATPASRRNHLITKHKYPKEYFFAITNHGLNQIAREDGLATSLIRPRKQGPPKPRRTSSTGHPTVDEPPPPPESVNAVEDTSAPSTTSEPSHLTTSEGSSANAAPMPMPCPSVPDVDMDDLTTRMGGLESSLGFVPRGVRKKAGVKAATAEAAEAANGAGAAAATSPGVG